MSLTTNLDFVLVSASAYKRCPFKRGRKYSNLIEVWPGPKNGVRLREVSTVHFILLNDPERNSFILCAFNI